MVNSFLRLLRPIPFQEKVSIFEGESVGEFIEGFNIRFYLILFFVDLSIIFFN